MALESGHTRASFFPSAWALPSCFWWTSQQEVEAKASEVTDSPFIQCGLFKEP